MSLSDNDSTEKAFGSTDVSFETSF